MLSDPLRCKRCFALLLENHKACPCCLASRDDAVETAHRDITDDWSAQELQRDHDYNQAIDDGDFEKARRMREEKE